MIPWLLAFYRYPVPLFTDEKETENYFTYKSMDIRGFKGLDHVSLNFSRNDLVLMLGLNESGKTSILKAIECFDYNNDPEASQLKSFFTSIRNKQDIDCNTPTTITAEIEFSETLDVRFFDRALRSAKLKGEVRSVVKDFLTSINTQQSVKITRVIPFSNGNARPTYYQFEDGFMFDDPRLEAVLAQEIVRRSPYIMYFEDFQDAIPARIYTRKASDGFNSVWYDIIDGIFFNTDERYSIKQYLGFYSKTNRRDDDASTVLRKVNNTLQETFTKKWRDLSGVEEIDQTQIAFQESKKYFEIKVTETDGTTYSVHERSKGAIWYLAFLMKTEFRKKKLREGSGKPIYLIDEPASNLHSTAQLNMINDFEKLMEDTTVIYTTHSRYLISPSNVKNTYIVSRKAGTVSCVKWGDYIKGKDAHVSYYQPLYDCLQIVPNSFDIPWHKAIITEGPSDAVTLEFMQLILSEKPTHVIYAGTSATKLTTLISLNKGWCSDFRILLDSDEEGKKQKARYMREHGLEEWQFVMHEEERGEIEKMFEESEKVSLYEVAFGERVRSVNKKQFLHLMRVLFVKAQANKEELIPLIGKSTKDRFRSLFSSLKAQGGHE